MGAAESKSHGGNEANSKAKLTFVQGVGSLQTTPVYTLRNAFFGKRPVSAFTYDPAQFALEHSQDFLPKAIRKLKTIRHPSVLKFIDCKTSTAGVHLITEQVEPLTLDYLEEITEDEILVGLFDIMVALHFLHSQCHISHNNVQLSSIFVSNGRWVLGGMEFTGTALESTEAGLTSLLPKELVPPELDNETSKKSNHSDLPHAVDIWQYGKMIESLVQDGLLHLKPNALALDRMLDSSPRKRPAGDIILESGLFVRNNAVSTVRYCRLKGLDKAQNAEWNQTIMSKLLLLPPSVMEKFVLPQLLTQEFFAADGFDKLYRTLFTPQPPQPLISEDTYRSQVMPFMIKLWTFRQADIRMTIFRLFEVYLKAVVLGEGGSEVLGQIILPEILAGLQDADPKVYLASLSGLATAIPYALLVTTLVDADLTKLKFSVKNLYEQTLIPHIMASWISEDSTQASRMQLVEVVMGMWCSIYTLGLQGHVAVKDMSATLTLTLVSVLKLSAVPERVELIARSFTKHATNGLFCISGLLKFLPQFLLDDDARVREATANAITSVALQAITLVPSLPDAPTDIPHDELAQESEGDSLGASTPSVSSPASTHSVHVSRIRQYCEKQQALLPPRRPIFSRSAFASERTLSSQGSLRGPNGLDVRALSVSDLSSRRSSIVSQDSFMLSEPSSLRTPSMTPSLTRAGSFSVEGLSKDGAQNSAPNSLPTAVLEKATRPSEATPTVNIEQEVVIQQQQDYKEPELKLTQKQGQEQEQEPEAMNEELSAEVELMKALEQAKAEMKMRQLPVETLSGKLAGSTLSLTKEVKQPRVAESTAFGWDSAAGDEGDDWETDDLTTLNTPSNQSPSSVAEPVEDEQSRQQREKEMAEKQEHLRQKRDQKQQEMQAKREARRLQLAEKQLQKKASSTGLRATVVAAAVPAAASAAVVVKATALPPPAAVIRAEVTEDADDWGMDDDIDLGALQQQAGTVDDELFKDLEVSYKSPAYVGGNGVVGAGLVSGSTTSIASSTSSSMTLSSSATTMIATPKITNGIKPAASFTNTTSTTTTTTTLSRQSPGTLSGGSSPATTPKRVASPLLKQVAQPAFKSLSMRETKASPPSASVSSPKSISSIALPVDDSPLEEDGWGDDWE